MTERREYEMTTADYDTLLEAMRPVPLIAIHCGPDLSRQERANCAWQALGDKMGFDGMTVQPHPTKSGHFFTAVPK